MKANTSHPTTSLSAILAILLLISGGWIPQHSHASPIDAGDETPQATIPKTSKARKPNSQKKSAAKGKKNKRDLENPEAEQSARRLVETHLPQLVPILKNLKQDSPATYQKAVFDLAKSARRLDTIAKRDQELLPIEIQLLQFRIEADLRTAKLKVRDNQEDRQALRTALTSYHETAIKRIQHETKVLQARLEKVQQQMTTAKARLDEKETHLEKNIDQAFQRHLRKAGRLSRAKKSEANKE